MVALEESTPIPAVIQVIQNEGHSRLPVFRDTIDRCDEILKPLLDVPLLDVLYGERGDLIDQTAWTQPALFALEYALASVWRSWGVEPAAVIGHSIGEYVAACVAGVMPLDGALRIVAARGRLMQSLPRDGSMVAVMADEARAREFVAARSADVSIAAVNGPASVVISGRTAAVEAVVAELTAAGIKSKPLNVSHAFHSPLMEPILDQFEAAVAGVALSAPRIKVISNVTGRAATAAELTSPRYWRDHLRGAVRFADGMQTLADGGFNVFVEAGPQPTAIAMATQSVPGGDRIWAASLRQKQEDWRTLLDAAAQLHLRGVEVDFAAIDRPFAARRTTLPPYPFQRTRFWVEPGAPAARTMVAFDDALHPLLGRRLTSPALNATVFEGRIARETHAYLYDHQVHGAAIMPATGFLELGLAAARAIGKAAPKVGDFAIREALTLPETGAVAVQVVMAAGEGGAKRFSIHSQSGDSWILHAEGSLEDAGHQDVPAPDVLDGGAIEPADFYARLRARGLEFGPAFHAVTRLAANGSEAEGLAELPSPLAAGESQFVVHPVLLDGALQVLAGALMSVEGGGDSYLPVHLEALELGEAPRGAVLARATLRDGDRRQLLRADITLLDPGDRRVVGRLTGLTLKRASRAALQRLRARDVSDTLYEIAWEPRELAVDDRLAWVPPAARLARPRRSFRRTTASSRRSNRWPRPTCSAPSTRSDGGRSPATSSASTASAAS
jgi:acyl transferase domain-containing protein